MANRAVKRLSKEMNDIKACADDELKGVEVNLVNDNM